MPLQAKVVTFNISTAAAGNTQDVTGFGFDPKAFIFWWSGIVSDVDAEGGGSITHGIGFAVSATDRRCMFSQSVDNVADSAADHGHRDESCVVTLDTAGAIDGIADVSALITDGIRLVIDDQFATAIRVHVLGLGGSTITNVETDQFQVPTLTGNQDITTIGFQPDTVLLLGAWVSTAPPSIRTGGSLGFGAAVSSTQRGVAETTEEDAQMAADVGGYGISTECIAISNIANANALVDRADFVQFLSNGFRVNWLAVHGTTQSYCHVLCIKGGNFVVGNFVTSVTLDADIVESGFGFSPACAIIVSACRAESTAGTPTADKEFSIGAFDSITSRGAQTDYADDASDPMIVGRGVEFDEVYINMAPATDALEGLVDIQSVDSDGFTLNQDDADPSANFCWYWAAGSAATKSLPPMRRPMAGLIVR